MHTPSDLSLQLGPHLLKACSAGSCLQLLMRLINTLIQSPLHPMQLNHTQLRMKQAFSTSHELLAIVTPLSLQCLPSTPTSPFPTLLSYPFLSEWWEDSSALFPSLTGSERAGQASAYHASQLLSQTPVATLELPNLLDICFSLYHKLALPSVKAGSQVLLRAQDHSPRPLQTGHS